MKTMKKIAGLLLAVCLAVPCASIITHAASGQIQFTDPSAKTGETVEVTCAVKSDNGTPVEDVNITMTYDTTMLKFKNGGGVTESSAGTLSYSGTGTSAALRFNMQFEALKTGTTQIKVTSYKAFLNTDEALTCQQGYATVTIAQGSGTTATDTPAGGTTPDAGDTKVTVNGVEYTLSSTIPASAIPEGFAETTATYEGAERKFVMQETTGIYLAYLIDANNNGKFFMYNTENATFAPFEQIQISTTTKIVLLSDASAIKMPEEYQEISLTVNGQDYPAWQNPENAAYYILYAINGDGEASLYQYDSEEGTYQRFETPEVVEEKLDNSVLGKLSAYVGNHFNYIFLIICLVFALFLVLVIVLGVKLHNRNLELDDLYDEYGIDMEDAEPEVAKKTERRRASEDEDEGIQIEDFEYEDDFDLKFEEELKEKEEQRRPSKTMQETESDFEDFDFDLIDLDE